MKSGFFPKILQITVIVTAVVFALTLPPSATGQDATSTVLIDRADKQNIVGITKIAIASGNRSEPSHTTRQGAENLVKAMNNWTDVQTSLDQNLMLSETRIMEFPFVIITADERLDLSQTEINILKRYISNGGFIFADSNDESIGGSTLRKMLEQVIPEARFETLDNTHEIYKCFYEPQQEQNIISMRNQRLMDRGGAISFIENLLEGVYYRGRLVAVYSNKGYLNEWSRNNTVTQSPTQSPNGSELQMGVNLIIFALTQEGSIGEQRTR